MFAKNGIRLQFARLSLAALVVLACATACSSALAALPQQSGSIDLLTQANVTINGDLANSISGYSVDGAGDVNSDGLADVIIGAPSEAPSGRTSAGSAYVIYGSVAPSDLSLASLGANGFRIDGAAAADNAGIAVAGAGDVNNDGFADVIVGAKRASPLSRTKVGAAYVIFGAAASSNVDLASLGARGFVIAGSGSSGDWDTGQAVAGAGDVNLDGYADVLVGAWGADPSSRADAGSAFLIYGSAAPTDVDVTALGARGVSIDGAAPGDLTGSDVGGAGDFNHDGYPDIIIGAIGGSALTNVGAGFVIYGSASMTNIDLASPLGTRGIRFDGTAVNGYLGRAVDGAGDVNGDGIDDVVIGEYAADPSSRTDAGSTYVLYGSASPTDVTVNSLGARGFRIDGAATNDLSGFHLGNAGDINGDGFADVLIGAEQADPLSRSNAGTSYVVYGSAVPVNVDLGTLGVHGILIAGAAAGDFCGTAVGGAGDVNGDGRPDLIIGSRQADPGGRSMAGTSSILYGFGTPALSYPTGLTGTPGVLATSAAPTVARTGAATFSMVTPLPTGLSIAPATGIVSGTPAALSTGTYTVSMQDLAGTTTATIEIGVYPVSTFAYASELTGTAGMAVRSVAPAVSTSGSPTFSMVTSLPAGLSIAPSTGVISGTPTGASAGNFTVSMQDLTGETTTTIVITVAAAPATSTGPVASTSTTAQQVHTSAVLHLKTSTSRVSASSSSITTTFRATGPGTVTQLATTTASRRALRAAGIKVCSATQTIDQAGAVTITCRLTNAAKRTRQASAIQVVLVTTFTPTSGVTMRSSRTVTVARTPVRAPNPATTPSIVTG
jgi:hypothetical protein